MKKAILIDGNSLMYRSYYATLPQLDYYINSNKKPANAIKLMMLYMFKLLSQKYDFALIAFDHKDKNFRKKIFVDYKANRKSTPETLIQQIEPIKNIMPLFGIKTICVSGLEADDLIASGVKKFSENGIFCEVFSSDKDMFQLVSDKCNVIQFKKGINDTVTYTNNNFPNLFFDLLPSQIVDFKALSGDPSDNIPGIKGIGNKIAISLLKKYNDIDGIIQNLEFIENKKIKDLIYSNKEKLFEFRNLIILSNENFNDQNLEDYKLLEMDNNKLKKIIEEFNFSGFSKYI